MSLAQFQRASKCPLIPPQLRIQFIHRRMENWKTFLRLRSSYYRPRYGRSSPSSPIHKSSKLTTKKSKTLHNHFPTGRAKRSSPPPCAHKKLEPESAQVYPFVGASRSPQDRSSKNGEGERRTKENLWIRKRMSKCGSIIKEAKGQPP